MYAEKRFEVIAPQRLKPSLDSFIDWLESKPPLGRYDFNNCKGECLLGQYMAYCGIEWTVIGPELLAYADTADKIFPNTDCHVLFEFPWTYGAALKRAKAYQGGDGRRPCY
jgi:hypothetical protein